MTSADKLKYAFEVEKCRRDAHYFIFDSKALLTKDEHDPSNPVKPMPDKEYLRIMLDCLLLSGKVIKPDRAVYARAGGLPQSFLEQLHFTGIFMTEKSRQVMATWLTCAYLFWRAKYRKHQLELVQSKREDDAANLVFNKESHVSRISFMEVNLPRYLRTLNFPRAGAYGQLFFPTGSRIWAIPEGGDIIRSNTPSVVFSDEAAFQPEFSNSFTAALPAIKGGGQYVAVSSAEPGSFQELVEAA